MKSKSSAPPYTRGAAVSASKLVLSLLLTTGGWALISSLDDNAADAFVLPTAPPTPSFRPPKIAFGGTGAAEKHPNDSGLRMVASLPPSVLSSLDHGDDGDDDWKGRPKTNNPNRAIEVILPHPAPTPIDVLSSRSSSATGSHSRHHHQSVYETRSMLAPAVSYVLSPPKENVSSSPINDSNNKRRPPPKSTNVVWHPNHVTRTDRTALSGHQSTTLWLTGLSGSGKSTIATALERQLTTRNIRSYVLDGDNIRHGLNSNLGFSPEDRTENVRRVGEVAKLFVDAGVIVICAFISPYRVDRDGVRSMFADDDNDNNDFIEVHVDATVTECERRDVKGLYKKARAGLIPNFTGISPDAPFEVPLNPEITVRTGEESIDRCTRDIIDYLEERGIIDRVGLDLQDKRP